MYNARPARFMLLIHVAVISGRIPLADVVVGLGVVA